MWEGRKTVHTLTWDESQCDKKLIEEFVPVLDSATESIAHNGDSFDIKWLRGRCLKHGIPMFPSYVTIDTLKRAKAAFRLNSNRLDYIGQYLGIGRKTHIGYDTWKAILLDGCDKSMRRMVQYNKNDVRLLSDVFHAFSGFIKPRTSIAGFATDCPECGSSQVGINHRTKRANGVVSLSLRCRDCGKFHTLTEPAFKKNKKLAIA